MQPTIISLFLLLLVAGATTSCDKDEPDGKSIFVDPAEEKTEFDFWLDRHYTEPYNIRFEYRMPDRETHFNYWVSPPPVDKSIEVAKLIKYSTLDAMAELMCERIAGTMLHEFMHILDGTYPVPSDYDTITQSDYVGDKYAQSGNDYMELGFVSKYARSSPAEDIAETGGRLISMSEEEWEAMLSSIESADGRAKIEKKRSILIAWLRDDFGVDVAKWSDIYLRRLSELGDIDWTNLED